MKNRLEDITGFAHIFPGSSDSLPRGGRAISILLLTTHPQQLDGLKDDRQGTQTDTLHRQTHYIETEKRDLSTTSADDNGLVTLTNSCRSGETLLSVTQQNCNCKSIVRNVSRLTDFKRTLEETARPTYGRKAGRVSK